LTREITYQGEAPYKWSCFQWTTPRKIELARFVQTLDGTRDENKFAKDKFLVQTWGIYYLDGYFNPDDETRDDRREFRGSDELRQELTREVSCTNPKCISHLNGKHEWGEVFSRKRIHSFIADAEKANESRYDKVDWRKPALLTENGIEQEYRPILKRICDAIRKAESTGAVHFYDELDYEDLSVLQRLHQQYSDSIKSIFDLLAIMDIYKWLETSNEDTSAYDDWLAFRPWESDNKMNEYKGAVQRGEVQGIDRFLSRNFNRPSDCYPYHLPTQIFDKLLPLQKRMERATNVIGCEPFETYTVSASPMPDEEHEWVVELDDREEWKI